MGTVAVAGPVPALRWLAALLLLLALAASASAKDFRKSRGDAAPDAAAALAPAPARDPLLAAQLAALAPQRPGHRDLYVLAFAGDGTEQVFRNEALYLRDLAAQRLDAAGRVVVLANHPADDVAPALPPADASNLRAALAAIGAAMDRDEDLLLLYLTTHGAPEHALYLARPGQRDAWLRPPAIRAALDDAGIRHRVIVVSACYAGGFAAALGGPDTLVLMAAHKARPSFGCGVDATATYFGEAFLVQALNQTIDFEAAFEAAKREIARREHEQDLPPSLPQIQRGARIAATLAEWRRGVSPGPALAYPWPIGDAADIATAGPGKGKALKQRR
ncbi:C13 family peptidase [Arenimonas composti]|uniref:C13 family peptidase n=1 Tax=Arenimonas composti TaxID=370776 RepID=UPI00041A91FF|nr:C13 family peptidase [Arenimonas composti]